MRWRTGGGSSALRHGSGLAVIEHEGRAYDVFVAMSVIGETDLPPSAPNAARWWGTVTGLPTSMLDGTCGVTISFAGKPARWAIISPPDRIQGEGDPLTI